MRQKIIVSRSYPTMFGNNWNCVYDIQSPDNTKKILIEFQDFYLTNAQFLEDADPTTDEPQDGFNCFVFSLTPTLSVYKNRASKMKFFGAREFFT